jgi:Do/DeqQ family serine protease
MDTKIPRWARRLGPTAAIVLGSLAIGLPAVRPALMPPLGRTAAQSAPLAPTAPTTPTVTTGPLPRPPNPALPAPQVASHPAPPPTSAAAEAMQLGRAFTEVANKVVPSVVSIRVTTEADADDPAAQLLLPFLSPGGDRHQLPLLQGSASGVIVRQDGVILTNHHVVERARRIEVHLRDGRSFRARVLGTDAPSDLALIKIDAHGLPTVRLGDSDQARVGEWVLAIGAPLGLEATVTQGVVSGMGRGGFGASEIEDYLQTDASINPGNSGGPLVNLRGEVIGINTMIVGRHSGIGMAIPSRIAQSVTEQLLRSGHVSRGWIGVSVQDMSDDLAHAMGTRATIGALVNRLDAGSPAARAGLQLGDVVTAIDGRPVRTGHDLSRAITRQNVGDRVALQVARGGQSRVVNVVTADWPENADHTPPPTAARGGGPRSRSQGLGLRVAQLPPQLAARVGVSPNVPVIVDVEPGSASDEAGLRPGDVVLRAGGREVRTSRDIQAALHNGQVALLIKRGEKQRYVPVSLE